MATLSDGTEIIVGDDRGAPSGLGVAKAVSVVQSRAYLEQRARQLLIARVGRQAWRHEAIDFGTEAARQTCEFLMCFVADASGATTSGGKLYVEVGFSLDLPLAEDPQFRLTVTAILNAAANSTARCGVSAEKCFHRVGKAQGTLMTEMTRSERIISALRTLQYFHVVQSPSDAICALTGVRVQPLPDPFQVDHGRLKLTFPGGQPMEVFGEFYLQLQIVQSARLESDGFGDAKLSFRVHELREELKAKYAL
jgi:hypothetical protein